MKAGLVPDNSLSDDKWNSFREYFNQPTATDIDCAVSIFSEDRSLALVLIEEYNSAVNNGQGLEDVEKVRVSDNAIIILSLQWIKNLDQLLKPENLQRDVIIKDLKSVKWTSLRQLARMAGISKGII